ncbi:MAG: hypothetical protein QNJ00_17165 [Woeseiaceae bacterium]|nr:hypothetical protein [Woeseiaceae bacterium]
MGICAGLVVVQPDPETRLGDVADDADAAAALLASIGLRAYPKDPDAPPAGKWDDTEIAVVTHTGGFLIDNYTFAGDVVHRGRFGRALASVYPGALITGLCVVDSTNYVSYARYLDGAQQRLVITDDEMGLTDEGERAASLEPHAFNDPDDTYSAARENGFALIDSCYLSNEAEWGPVAAARFHWKPPGLMLDLLTELFDAVKSRFKRGRS